MVERFVIDPPRRSDEGVARACIRIADISVAIVCDDPEMRLEITEAAKKFLVDATEAHVRVGVAWDDLVETSGGEKIFDSGALWQLYRDNGSYLFRFASPVFGPGPYKIAFFCSDFTAGEVYVHRQYATCDQPIYPLEYPLDELLIINLLAQGRGVEVHAAGVVDLHGNGYLFLGHSGAGKTTMARLWQNAEGVQILSDDRAILRNVGQRLWMYGTPWHGEAPLASPVRAPLTRIYLLRRGQKNVLVPLSRAEAVARLFACSFPLFYSPEALDFTMGFLEEVVKAVPCFELRFLPDKRVVEFIQRSQD